VLEARSDVDLDLDDSPIDPEEVTRDDAKQRMSPLRARGSSPGGG
jgi:hypothetical protein